MELGSMVKDVLQNVAEHAASYSIGQTALRYLDRSLKVIEKCARWAVPPPLDQDERPQPELVRPLPWVFFLCTLIVLRVMRESISLANLIMGKPPLRSADVVIYIQSKRRYLRTLKYQGNRIMRARTGSAQPREPWYSSLRSLFEFTMCFRRNSLTYGNNNTTSVSNNEEVLVVKRNKRGREDASPVTSGSVESPMERLIEKMMVDLNADSDEDSSYTLTDVTSVKSEKLEMQSGSDQATVVNTSLSTIINSVKPGKVNDEIYFSPPENAITSTPVKTENTNQKKDSVEQKKDHNEQKKERTEQRIGNIEQEKDNNEQSVHNTEREKQNTEQRKDKTEEKKENTEQRKDNIEQKKDNTAQRKVNIEQKKDNTEQKEDNTEQKKDNTVERKDSTEQKEDNTEQKKDNTVERKDNTEQKKDDIEQKRENFESKKDQSEPKKQRNEVEKENPNTTKEKLEIKKKENEMIVEDKNETAPLDTATMTPEEASLNFIQNERCPQKVQRTPKNEKIANGRTIKSVPSKKKGSQTERREQNATTARLLSENKSF